MGCIIFRAFFRDHRARLIVDQHIDLKYVLFANHIISLDLEREYNIVRVAKIKTYC